MRSSFSWTLALLAGLLSGPALAQTPAAAPAATTTAPEATDARQLWQLLDYVAVDYSGAVENGQIASEGEYAEMLDFSANALQQAGALPGRVDVSFDPSWDAYLAVYAAAGAAAADAEHDDPEAA